MITGLAVAAALGLAKSQLVDKPAAQKQRDLSAAKTRLSPWTGVQGGPVKEADPWGSALQAGAMGAVAGSGYHQQEQNDLWQKEQMDLTKAQANRLNSGGSPFQNAPSGTMASGTPLNYAQKLGDAYSSPMGGASVAPSNSDMYETRQFGKFTGYKKMDPYSL